MFERYHILSEFGISVISAKTTFSCVPCAYKGNLFINGIWFSCCWKEGNGDIKWTAAEIALKYHICHYLKWQIKNTGEVLRKYMLVLHWRKQTHECRHCSYTIVHTPYTLEGTAFFWGHNCVQVFLEQRSHWSARTLSETSEIYLKYMANFLDAFYELTSWKYQLMSSKISVPMDATDVPGFQVFIHFCPWNETTDCSRVSRLSIGSNSP